jgi:hypothetical protein
MARIINKDTRLIDIDFGPVTQTLSRNAAEEGTGISTLSLNGTGQILMEIPSIIVNPPPAAPTLNIRLAGSFVQYQRIDLSYMTENNEVYQPVDISVQRTSPVPLGFTTNANTFDQIEEYIYVFTRPLNNASIESSATLGQSNGANILEQLRSLGLDSTQATSQLGGLAAGIPTHVQTVFAEKRIYDINLNNAATITNGAIVNPVDPLDIVYNTITGMPLLSSVTTWGTMSGITGPNLHCYRVVINRTQQMYGLVDGTGASAITNVQYAGQTLYRWPAVNVTLLAKDASLNEGEYLTTVANAMNSLPEGGQAA